MFGTAQYCAEGVLPKTHSSPSFWASFWFFSRFPGQYGDFMWITLDGIPNSIRSNYVGRLQDAVLHTTSPFRTRAILIALITSPAVTRASEPHLPIPLFGVSLLFSTLGSARRRCFEGNCGKIYFPRVCFKWHLAHGSTWKHSHAYIKENCQTKS